MKEFGSIEGFRHIVQRMKRFCEHHHKPLPTLSFKGTVKLHGSNFGVRKLKGDFYPQSRHTSIDLQSDSFGFASFIDGIPTEQLKGLFDSISDSDDITLFGEWIGPKIQSKVAINSLPRRQWVLFRAWDGIAKKYISLPQKACIPEYDIYNIHSIPGYTVTVDFSEPAKALETLEKLTLEVEERCPWAEQFGINGVGEGIVWSCVERPDDSDLWFKTKGTKHKRGKNNKRKVATVDPEVLEKLGEVVELVLPEDRLYQGLEYLSENALDIEPRNMGTYLRWIANDVKKEENDVLEANGVTLKEIGKLLNTKAKQFFFDRMEQL